MDGITSFLDTRASFEASALVATWIGLALLTVMLASLLIRLRRVELAGAAGAPERNAPYAQLRGRRVSDLLPPTALAERPRLLLFLSANCRACSQILAELTQLQPAPRTGLVWIDGTPLALPPLPGPVFILPQGAELARQLGVHVTPFVVEVDEGGVIVDGKPVNQISSLGFASNGSRAHQVA
jgi:hypothetical protein